MFDDQDGIGTLTGGNMGLNPAANPVRSMTQQEHEFLRLPPHLIFASGLFQARYLRRRQALSSVQVQSTCSARSLSYSGESLDQFDLDVYLACARYAPRQVNPVPAALKVDLSATARTLLRAATTPAKQRVLGALRRLEAARIRVSDSRFTYDLQPMHKVLHDSKTDRCLVELNPEILRSLQSVGNLNIFINDRFRLGMKGVDRWLHAVLHFSPGLCIPFGGLAGLAGNAEMPPRQLEETLRRLQDVVRPDELNLGKHGLEISRTAPAARRPS